MAGHGAGHQPRCGVPTLTRTAEATSKRAFDARDRRSRRDQPDDQAARSQGHADDVLDAVAELDGDEPARGESPLVLTGSCGELCAARAPPVRNLDDCRAQASRASGGR